MEADVQAVGLGRTQYAVAQDRKGWEETCRQCCDNQNVGHCEANMYKQAQIPTFLAHVDT